MGVLSVAIPKLAKHFQLAPQVYATAASASVAGMAIGAMLLAQLADRFGRRMALFFFQVLIGVAMLGAAHSITPFELATWRFFSGLGIGAILPVAIAATADAAPPRRRGIIVTTVVSFSALGSFLSGFLAAPITDLWDWPGLFLVGAMAPIASGIAALLLLPVSEHITRRKGAASETGIHSSPFRSPDVRKLIFFLSAILWINLLVNHSISSWLPTILTMSGRDYAEAAQISGLKSIGGILGGLAIGIVSDRGRLFLGLIFAYLISGLVLIIAPFAISASFYYWAILVIMLGFGSYGSAIAVGSLCATFFAQSIRASATGLISGFGRTGAIVGPFLLATFMNQQMPAHLLLSTLVVPIMLCATLVLILGRMIAGGKIISANEMIIRK